MDAGAASDGPPVCFWIFGEEWMLVRVLVGVALVATGTAALPQDAAPPAPAEQVKEKKICRSETPTGSVMAKRVCRTKAEWARLAEQNERENQRFRDRPSGTGPT